MMIVLVYKESYFNTNELDPYITSVVVSLLQEFNDVYPKDIPNDFTPIWGIKQKSDLISRAAISNWLAYQSNLKKIKDFQGM